MKTLRTNCAAVKTKWKLAGGFGVSLVAILIAASLTCATVQAADALPNVNAPLKDQNGNALTQGQMALNFAHHLTPPFTGSSATDAITWLMGGAVNGQAGHKPPISPLGGWDASKPATVGDLTVCLVQQLRIEPKAAGGGQPTAQDYQTALVDFGQTASPVFLRAIGSLFQDWVQPSLNPLGPQPTPDNPTRTGTAP